MSREEERTTFLNVPRESLGLTVKSIADPKTGLFSLILFEKNVFKSNKDLTIELFPELLHPTRNVNGEISTETPFLSKTLKFLIV